MVPGNSATYTSMRAALMGIWFGNRLPSLGRGRKNLLLEGLWENPLNSASECPMDFERKIVVSLEVGAERMSWIECKGCNISCVVSSMFTPTHNSRRMEG